MARHDSIWIAYVRKTTTTDATSQPALTSKVTWTDWKAAQFRASERAMSASTTSVTATFAARNHPWEEVVLNP